MYVGAIGSENDAAKYYDSIAILCQGLNAKTNFKYNAKKIRQILQEYDIYSDSPKQAVKRRDDSAEEDDILFK